LTMVTHNTAQTSHAALIAEVQRLREVNRALVTACRAALLENHCTPDTDTILRAALALAGKGA
jgi:hypothetical protein